MAVQELGGIAEVEGWDTQVFKPWYVRLTRSLENFARRKPLGFVCGVIVIFFFIVGDVVPETINKASKTPVSIPGVGTIKPDWGTPIPYVADQLEQTFSWIYPYSKQDLRARLQGSSNAHLLGTDAIGRDIFSRLLYGARTAVMVSFGGVFISMTIGSVIGIMSGFYGSWVDKGLYRIVDVFQALPPLVIFIVILGVFGSGLWQLIFVLGFVGGPIQSRLIRGQTIYVMSSPFIEAAKVIGCGDRRIMVRYILPNVFHLIVLQATFSLGFLVLLEATLSFLGYGLPPPFPSWGQMLSLDGRQYMRTQPGLAIYPGVAIGILVFSFNLFGDALRDVLDPRLRGSR
jgi:peptide/nickel transport system permease protein